MSAEQSSASQQLSNVPDAPKAVASDSTAKEYIAKKLNPQREWFDRKARRSKFLHYSLIGMSMAATTLIVLANSVHMPLLSSVLALVATLATGAAGLLKSQENWVRYRNAANALESLKLKYDIGAPPFDGPDRHGLIIQEAERIFAEEQSQWAAKVSESAIHPSLPAH
jgi:hypothetical protein